MKTLEVLKQVLEIAGSKGFPAKDIEWGHIVDGTNYYSIIFRHDFAKAFWGEEDSYQDMMEKYRKMEAQGKVVDYSLIPPPKWKRNLEAMVLAEDKIEFLAKYVEFINNGSVISADEMAKRKSDLMADLKNRFKGGQ